MSSFLSNKRICVTGGAGFLGRAVCAELVKRGFSQPFVPRSDQFDLTRAEDVARLFEASRCDVVIHLAAEVGGIGANRDHLGRFFYANMAMGLHLIEEARKRGIEKFVQVGTVCAYPKHCAIPFREDSLWEGFPEETNAPYGVAKRALGVMLDAYRKQYGFRGIYLIPVNLYGPGDNFDLETSHVIPALIRKFCDAVDHRQDAGATQRPASDGPPVMLWGTGRVSREFLYVDDAAEGIVTAAEHYDGADPVNLGTGRETKIADLADLTAGLCGYTGRIQWDLSRPDGQPRRRLDVTRAAEFLKWRARVDLEAGLRRTIAWWRSRGCPVSEARPS